MVATTEVLEAVISGQIFYNEEGVWLYNGSEWKLVVDVPATKLSAMTFDEFLTASAKLIEEHQQREE